MSDSATEPRAETDRDLYDPTYLHTRREAAVILTAWGVCLVWTVGYCWFTGYGAAEGGEVVTTLGLPSWVFWGVALPWAVALTFSVVYGLWFIAEDDLGEGDEEEASEETAGETAGEVTGAEGKGGGDV